MPNPNVSEVSSTVFAGQYIEALAEQSEALQSDLGSIIRSRLPRHFIARSPRNWEAQAIARFPAPLLPDVSLARELENVPQTAAVPGAILANWEALAASNISEDVYQYLVKLARKQDGWRGPGSRALRAGSLRYFLHFWQGVKDTAVEPELVLLPNGGLQAEWFKGNKQFVEIEFRVDGLVLFGIFDGVTVLEGQANLIEIRDALLHRRQGACLKWGGFAD